jgi:hypothetical protein
MRCPAALAPVANGHMGGRDTPQEFEFEQDCALELEVELLA